MSPAKTFRIKVRVQNTDRIPKVLTQLTPIERQILELRASDEEPTLLDVGKKYKLSRERIRQLETRALDRVKQIMVDEDLGPRVLHVRRLRSSAFVCGAPYRCEDSPDVTCVMPGRVFIEGPKSQNGWAYCVQCVQRLGKNVTETHT